MVENQQIQKRQIAYKVRIKDIISGKYVREDGWQPNYVLFEEDKKISRVNLIGIIVARSTNEGSYQNMLLDDGSGKISIRFFQPQNIQYDAGIGDAILLIGRIREYGSERYIVPEIIKKIENKVWIDVRKVELKQQTLIPLKKEEIFETEQKVPQEEIKAETSPLQDIYNLIKKLDKGEGVDIEEIIQSSKENNVETIINNLLEKGEIFEIRKGRLKVLE